MDDKTNVVLAFSQAALSKLDAIVNKAGVKSRADAIRNALRLYEWWLGEQASGSKLIIDRDGKYSEVELVF